MKTELGDDLDAPSGMDVVGLGTPADHGAGAACGGVVVGPAGIPTASEAPAAAKGFIHRNPKRKPAACRAGGRFSSRLPGSIVARNTPRRLVGCSPLQCSIPHLETQRWTEWPHGACGRSSCSLFVCRNPAAGEVGPSRMTGCRSAGGHSPTLMSPPKSLCPTSTEVTDYP